MQNFKDKNIIIGSDHAGFKLKNKIIAYLNKKGYTVTDEGTFSETPCDYPDIAHSVSKKVANGLFEKGILICGTGIGMSVAANKTKGIRAVVCSDTTSAQMSRLHNNSNILCFGERIIGEYTAKDICDIWLNTGFEEERHLKRINLIEP